MLNEVSLHASACSRKDNTQLQSTCSSGLTSDSVIFGYHARFGSYPNVYLADVNPGPRRILAIKC